MRVELIALRSIRVGGTYFWAPALEFSTLLEVTEAGTIHVHASCTRPTRCTPVLLGFKGVKWGSKLCPYRHCRCLRHLLWGMCIVIAGVCDTYFGAPVLEFSTLLEATEAVAMYVYASCL